MGYINVSVSTKGIDTANLNDCLMLIVPTTDYSQKYLTIIGTNFIHNVMESVCEQNVERFLQKTKMTIPWYLAFRFVSLRKKNLIEITN